MIYLSGFPTRPGAHETPAGFGGSRAIFQPDTPLTMIWNKEIPGIGIFFTR